MNKSINSVLGGIRNKLEEPKTEAAPPLVAEGAFAKLAAKLKANGAKDPEALAAWIGRKKYGKERFASMAKKESVDVEQMLVFEDVEDVLAFVEGLASLVEYEEPKGTYAKGDLTVEWPPDMDHDMSPKVKAVVAKAGGLITVNKGSYGGSAVEAIFRMNGGAIEKMLGRKLRRVGG